MPLLQTAAANAMGGIMGLALGGINDNRQIRQQQKLTDMSLSANKSMTDYNYSKQLQMWKDTNYSAQIAEMKKAGINPALLYGMSGGGGVTTGSGGGGMGMGQAPQGGGEIQAMVGMGLQTAMQTAQIEAIKAQTEKTKVETAKTAGVDTDLGRTQIASLTQGITNAQTSNELMQLEKRIEQVNAEITENTQQAQENRWSQEQSIRQKQIEILENDVTISDATVQEKIKIIQQQAIGSVLDNIQKRANTKLTNEQITAIKTGIKQKWTEIAQGDVRNAIEIFKAEVNANNPSIWNVAGAELQNVIEDIWEMAEGKGARQKRKVDVNKTGR